MNDVLMPVIAIVLLITIFGCIPYGIWIIYSLFKKRWKRVVLQIAVPIVIYALLLGVSVLINSKAHTDYINGLYDCKVSLGSAIFEYDSERTFNGDGYSFSVYELPSTVRQRFESVDENC